MDDGSGRKGLRLQGPRSSSTGDLDRRPAASATRTGSRTTRSAASPCGCCGRRPAALPTLDLGPRGDRARGDVLDRPRRSRCSTSPLTDRAARAVWSSSSSTSSTPPASRDVDVSDLGAAIDLRDDADRRRRRTTATRSSRSCCRRSCRRRSGSRSRRAQGQGVELHGGIGATPGRDRADVPARPRHRRRRPASTRCSRSAGRAAARTEIDRGALRRRRARADRGRDQRVGLRAPLRRRPARSSAFKPPDGFGLSLDASTHALGGFLLVDEAHGRYVGAIEIAIAREVLARRDRHHHHEEARRHARLLAADADHDHVAGADPARLRVLLRRRRRPARPQPRHRPRPPAPRPAHRHRRLHPVPDRHRPPDRRDRARPRGGLPGRARAASWSPRWR